MDLRIMLVAALFLAPSTGASAAPPGPTPLPAPAKPGKAPRRRKSSPSPASRATQAMLASIGWKGVEEDALVRLDGAEKGYIPGNYLVEADIEWRNGALAFTGGDEIDPKLLPRILDGLWVFVSAAEVPPADAAKALAAWGLPTVIDGRELVNPDGSATYCGQMLRLLYAQKPEALGRASVERLSQALDHLLLAHDQAFDHQAADMAKTEVDRVELMLFAPFRPGETPIGLAPHEDIASELAAFENKLDVDRESAMRSGDPVRADESKAAINVLHALKRQHYHTRVDLPTVPPPGRPPTEKPDDESSPKPGAPLSSGLPIVLRALERINGRPLTQAQQESLIKSFPMGDLIWRLGAQNLWREGLTGKGVQIAVIDHYIGRHDELATAVKSRINMTAERGNSLAADHGTHVAGTIHAIAPDAQLNGYAVFAGDDANPALETETEPLILRAIERAVADGNRIISMSLGAGVDNPASDLLTEKIEEYKKQGVIFIVAAGNDHADHGVEAPSTAPNALSVGALDAAGRPADFSSYGDSFDPRGPGYIVKKIFMLPGTNIYSTVVRDDGTSGYGLLSGTSMATPALSGVVALLAQAAGTMNPVVFSARLNEALTMSSTQLPLDKLPANVPFDQQFLAVNPMAALDALRQEAAPLTAGNSR